MVLPFLFCFNNTDAAHLLVLERRLKPKDTENLCVLPSYNNMTAKLSSLHPSQRYTALEAYNLNKPVE